MAELRQTSHHIARESVFWYRLPSPDDRRNSRRRLKARGSGSIDPGEVQSADAGNLVAKKGDAVEKKFMGPLFRLALFALIALPSIAIANGAPRYTIADVVRLARAQNPEIAIARKKIQAARGGQLEARSGYLPSVVSGGFYRRGAVAQSSQLRPEDYNASLKVVENLYTGGATSNQVAIARLTLAKQLDELQAVTDRVTMDVRLAFYELLLNREKIHVREQSVAVLREEL